MNQQSPTPIEGNIMPLERSSRSIHFEFDPRKALEVILYISNKLESPDFHKISKILYFSDKNHLERYGRLVCGDSYVAMKHGPVPSGVYDILKTVRGDGLWSCVAREKLDMDSFSVHDRKTVVPLRRANTDLLSESDIECLDEAINEYGLLEFSELTEASHDFAWKSVDQNDVIDIEAIVATLSNSSDLLEHLRENGA